MGIFNRRVKTIKFDMKDVDTREVKFERINVKNTQPINFDEDFILADYMSRTTQDLEDALKYTEDKEEKKLIKKILKKD